MKTSPARRSTAGLASKRLLPALVALLLLLAGCSDSEDGTEAGIDGDAVNELLEDTESGSDDESDPPEDDDASEQDQDFDGDDSEDFCSVAEELDETVDGFGDSTDPAVVKASMEATLDGFERARRVAPDEISEAVDVNADTFATLNDELEKVEYNLLDLDLSILNALETEEFQDREFELESYLFEVCQIGDAPTVDDDPVEDEPLPEGSVREQMAEQLVNGGFTAAEAECVLAEIDPSNPEALADPQVLLAVFTECGIPLERLAELGG